MFAIWESRRIAWVPIHHAIRTNGFYFSNWYFVLKRERHQTLRRRTQNLLFQRLAPRQKAFSRIRRSLLRMISSARITSLLRSLRIPKINQWDLILSQSSGDYRHRIHARSPKWWLPWSFRPSKSWQCYSCHASTPWLPSRSSSSQLPSIPRIVSLSFPICIRKTQTIN